DGNPLNSNPYELATPSSPRTPRIKPSEPGSRCCGLFLAQRKRLAKKMNVRIRRSQTGRKRADFSLSLLNTRWQHEPSPRLKATISTQ
ncbi:hypothetical protein M9458_054149, partial [Cirrhinus mrigala]